MPAEEAGNVGTQRHDMEMIGAGKIQRGAREFRGESLALQWLRHFGVLQHEAIRETAVSNERGKPVHRGLEAVGRFIVRDSYGVQI